MAAAAFSPTSQEAACSAVAQHSVGLGLLMVDKDQVHNAIYSAIQAGYRRIDNAAVYFNEDAVGDALASVIHDGLVQRDELFVVSKLASPFHRAEHVELALRKTLNDLRLDYLDLYLVHWPVTFEYVPIDTSQRGYPDEEIDESDNGKRIDPTVSLHETWQAMEGLVDKGLVKYIGVSNFPVMTLHELLSKARIPPAVNQCEGHPYLQQRKLVEYCNKRGVHFQAYSSLGTPGYKEDGEPSVLDDPILQQIASQHNCSVAQVCIAWALQRGTSVVAKSVTPNHQQANLQAQSIQLSDDEMAQIATLDRGYRFFRPEDWWGDYAMAVFD